MTVVLHGLKSQDMTSLLYLSEFKFDGRVPVFENNLAGSGRRHFSFNPADSRGRCRSVFIKEPAFGSLDGVRHHSQTLQAQGRKK